MIFKNSIDPKYRLLHPIVMFVIYLMGIFHWGWFCNFGKLHNKVLDWQKFHIYFSIFKESLCNKTIPYFVPYQFKGTHRFLALPETDLSPHTLLLGWISVENYIVFSIFVFYSIGFWGCLCIRKKFKLSLYSFLILFLIFNFNGYITAHLGVGHWPWLSYFYLPFFVYWVMQWLGSEAPYLHWEKIVLVLFLMLLQGGLHMYVICLLFLGMVMLAQRKRFLPGLMIILVSGLLASFRVIPAGYTFWEYKNEFLYGFPDLRVFAEALLTINGYTTMVEYSSGWFAEKGGVLPWWDLDCFISILGLGFLLYFGVILRFRKESASTSENSFRSLDIPLLGMILLSFGSLYGLIAQLPIPLVSVERVSARFFVIPFVFLLVIACVRLQGLLNAKQLDLKMRLIMGLAALCQSGLLVLHSSLWRFPAMEQAGFVYLPGEYRLSDTLASQPQEGYLLSLSWGLALSMITAAFFLGGIFYKQVSFPSNRSLLQSK